MSYEAGEAYWKVNPEYFDQIDEVMTRRQRNVDVSFTDMVDDMAAHGRMMEAADELRKELPLEFGDEDKKLFYLNFAYLIKFLYPVMEEIETIVQNNIRPLNERVDESNSDS